MPSLIQRLTGTLLTQRDLDDMHAVCQPLPRVMKMLCRRRVSSSRQGYQDTYHPEAQLHWVLICTSSLSGDTYGTATQHRVEGIHTGGTGLAGLARRRRPSC